MRLGAYRCELQPGSRAHRAYQTAMVHERHRHRWEVNNRYLPQLIEHGLQIGGLNPETKLVEIMELAGHPWFVGVQFHPELRSRALHPHPLFRDFVAAALKFAGK